MASRCACASARAACEAKSKPFDSSVYIATRASVSRNVRMFSATVA
jgi:hypothetical protein